jgi:hypothetical protein
MLQAIVRPNFTSCRSTEFHKLSFDDNFQLCFCDCLRCPGIALKSHAERRTTAGHRSMKFRVLPAVDEGLLVDVF